MDLDLLVCSGHPTTPRALTLDDIIHPFIHWWEELRFTCPSAVTTIHTLENSWRRLGLLA